MIPFNTPPPPSERAQALSQSLTEAIRDFQHRHPGTDAQDVQQALMLAASGTQARVPRLAFAMVILIMLLGMAVAGWIYLHATPGL